MAGAGLLEKLQAEANGIRGRLMAEAPMARLTWFQVGGPADLLFQPADAADLARFLEVLPAEISVTVVGVGSNLLVRDGGVEGVVIRLSAKGFGQLERVGETRILAGAAVPDKRLAAFALEQGIGGLEFYHGIPGGVGGALRMNAGANGTETADRLVSVEAVDRSGRRSTLARDEMGYSYRHCGAPGDLIFTAATFEGVKREEDEIRAAMEAVQHHRESVQPIREKTGGSTFKNPPGGSAWREIDKAGCRGLKVGGAQMSPMHCNFMINTGEASAHDLEMLGETVRARVLENSAIQLEWEIRRIGRFETDRIVEASPGRTSNEQR